MKRRKKDKSDHSSLSLEEREIYEWLRDVKFQKSFLGGVDESDVWKKIQELNRMYEKALLVEKKRYETLHQAYQELLVQRGGADDGIKDESSETTGGCD